MARRKRKRRVLRGAFLLGAAGAAAGLARKLMGGEPETQSFSDAARPVGQEERPIPDPPVRPATAAAEGTGSGDTVESEALATAPAEDLTPAPGTDEVVKPDDSKGDPLVEEQVDKAAAEARDVGSPNREEMP
jgi:hypothetical protein